MKNKTVQIGVKGFIKEIVVEGSILLNFGLSHDQEAIIDSHEHLSHEGRQSK